ncbi:tripartite motif-containing protein 65 isoform X1 [Sesbania bispinosa]|nr:tripartite motif-containing protein 65 isoform X1 [Sesbania bispinosa]
MVVSEEQKRSPINQKNPLTQSNSNSQNVATLFSPRFKSAAAMAGWDEEALLLASLIVEDTPERDRKCRKRTVLTSKTPPTNSARKRRGQRSPQPITVPVINLDEEETPTKDSGKKKKEKKTCVNEGTKVGGNELPEQKSSGVSSTILLFPALINSGRSFPAQFVWRCAMSQVPLLVVTDKCGKKCPKCRQFMSNGRACTVNTVLWNTIQLLFPQEVEARKAAGALNSRQSQCVIPEKAFYSNLRNGSTQTGASSRSMSSRRGATTQEDEDSAFARSQDEDAALALRLQREEFMQVQSSRPSSSSLARANLRAMASRAMNLRIRDRRT